MKQVVQTNFFEFLHQKVLPSNERLRGIKVNIGIRPNLNICTLYYAYIETLYRKNNEWMAIEKIRRAHADVSSFEVTTMHVFS